MNTIHLDTDFLVVALSDANLERSKLLELNKAGAPIHMSAVAWYEFSRGPRSPEQLALARFFIDAIVPLDDTLATKAGVVFHRLGSPRRRANDIAIGVTAAEANAHLFTLNGRDFRGIPNLRVAVA